MAIEIELPLVRETTSVATALERVRSQKRGAVLVDRGQGRFEILERKDLLKARTRGVERVEDVRVAGLKAAPPAKPAGGPLAAKSEEEIGAIFGASRARFVVKAKERGSARLISRRERYADRVVGAGRVCVCNNSKCPYNCDSPPGRTGNRCPRCRDGRLACY